MKDSNLWLVAAALVFGYLLGDGNTRLEIVMSCDKFGKFSLREDVFVCEKVKEKDEF